MDFIIQNFNEFLTFTGFANASAGNLIMILVAFVDSERDTWNMDPQLLYS